MTLRDVVSRNQMSVYLVAFVAIIAAPTAAAFMSEYVPGYRLGGLSLVLAGLLILAGVAEALRANSAEAPPRLGRLLLGSFLGAWSLATTALIVPFLILHGSLIPPELRTPWMLFACVVVLGLFLVAKLTAPAPQPAKTTAPSGSTVPVTPATRWKATTYTPISTRRGTVGAALGLIAVVLVSGASLALLLWFLTTSAAPGLFRPAATTGHAVANPAAVAANGFPYRHLTIQADSELPGRATVTLDDGTGQPGAVVTRSIPFDGGPPSDPATACDTDGVCWDAWTITPALDVTISTTYQGATCVITGNPDSRPRITCDGHTLPN